MIESHGIVLRFDENDGKNNQQIHGMERKKPPTAKTHTKHTNMVKSKKKMLVVVEYLKIYIHIGLYVNGDGERTPKKYHQIMKNDRTDHLDT